MYPFTNIDEVILRGNKDSSKGNFIGDTESSSTSVASLRTLPESLLPQRLHGVITFVSPIYLQDNTGGIELQIDDRRALSIGDEIEASGHPIQGENGLIFSVASLRLLRDRNPVFPVSITPAEAMTGNHEGVLIDIAGEVIFSQHEPDGTTKLVLSADGQTFDAFLQSDIFSPSVRRWSIGSTVRVRGVCVFRRNSSEIPRFSVLVAQPSDVTELVSPSWRRGWRLLLLIFGAVLIVATGVLIFVRSERSKSKAILQERARLSHDMHDTLAQSFAGVGYHLQGLRKTVEEQELLPAPLLEDLDIACRMVRETHREASASIAALHPNSQKDGDLLEQLEHSVSSMLDKSCLSLDVRCIGRVKPLPPALADVFFRVGLEALANVFRHSEATKITLSLIFYTDKIALEVADNGIGFAAHAARSGFGIETMRRRCEAVKANFEIDSAVGTGCTIRIVSRAVSKRPFFQRLSWIGS